MARYPDRVKTYALSLESGPRRKKTMVHVFDLLGCIANGPTTEAALEATPEAIRAYLRFLSAQGERVDPDAPFEVTVTEHVTEGEWLGNGSPYARFEGDVKPVGRAELGRLLERFVAMRQMLASWVSKQPAKALDAKPRDGRTARAIALHVLGPTGGYLSPVLGGAPGFSRLLTQAERGEIPLDEALVTSAAMVVDQAGAMTPEQRRAVIERPKEVRTARKALRRLLEHDWEHLRELSRRSGGPDLG